MWSTSLFGSRRASDDAMIEKAEKADDQVPVRRERKPASRHSLFFAGVLVFMSAVNIGMYTLLGPLFNVSYTPSDTTNDEQMATINFVNTCTPSKCISGGHWPRLNRTQTFDGSEWKNPGDEVMSVHVMLVIVPAMMLFFAVLLVGPVIWSSLLGWCRNPFRPVEASDDDGKSSHEEESKIHPSIWIGFFVFQLLVSIIYGSLVHTAAKAMQKALTSPTGSISVKVSPGFSGFLGISLTVATLALLFVIWPRYQIKKPRQGTHFAASAKKQGSFSQQATEPQVPGREHAQMQMTTTTERTVITDALPNVTADHRASDGSG